MTFGSILHKINEKKSMTECEYARDNGTESCRWWECGTGSVTEWALESKSNVSRCAGESPLQDWMCEGIS